LTGYSAVEIGIAAAIVGIVVIAAAIVGIVVLIGWLQGPPRR
jgi:hypothetical protein